MLDRPPSLKERLGARIKSAGGSISLSEFMELALYDPDNGYYTSGKVRFGREGDFFTNPTVSRLFGRAIARYLIPALCKMVRPIILEPGPGDGHLAKDVLDSLKLSAPDLYENTRYVLLERSPALQERQSLLLRDHQDHLLFIPTLEQFQPTKACAVIANEFFDAFPARRWVWSHGNFTEMRVSQEGGQFRWTPVPIAPEDVPPLLRRLAARIPAGTLDLPMGIHEFIAGLIRRIGDGICLFFDYGDTAMRLVTSFPRGTLRAQIRHEVLEDPLSDPGERDLSVFVPVDLLLYSADEEPALVGEPAPRAGAFGNSASGWRFAYFPTQAEFLMKTTFPEVLKEVLALPEGNEKFRLQMQARTLVNPEGIGGAMFALLIASPAFDFLLPD